MIKGLHSLTVGLKAMMRVVVAAALLVFYMASREGTANDAHPISNVDMRLAKNIQQFPANHQPLHNCILKGREEVVEAQRSVERAVHYAIKVVHIREL